MATQRILIVDDEADAAETLAMLCADRGHDVTIVRDGAAAIDVARWCRPHVIFCDLNLLSVTGYDVARAILRDVWDPRMQIIAVSGWGQPEAFRLSKQVGFTHHLVKPIDPGVFFAVLAEASAAW